MTATEYAGFTIERSPITGYWHAHGVVNGYLVHRMADTLTGLRSLIRQAAR